MLTDTLIIGGGLSGLSLAAALAERSADFQLLEARDRLGGRILTRTVAGGSFDLGPAWFWPGQPRVEALVSRLGLTAFEQYQQGDLLFEAQQGPVLRGPGSGATPVSFRLEGGFGALVAALAARVAPDRVHLSSKVRALSLQQAHVTATLENAREVAGRRAVLALPPRLAAHLTFKPAIVPEVREEMRRVPTWMAGQAKAVAVYSTPFWRAAGLSGQAMSRRGPMVEIHDASSATAPPFALFGFIGVPPQARTDSPGLRRAVLHQLERLFGPAAAEPTELIVKDWAIDPFTATEEDGLPLAQHPRYGPLPALSRLWDGRLVFAATEAASEFGGYVEGALEASENALALIDS